MKTVEFKKLRSVTYGEQQMKIQYNFALVMWRD